MQTDTNGPHNTAIPCWRMARLCNGLGLTTGPLTGPLGPPSEASTAEGSPARTHRQRTDSAPSPLTQSKAATRATAPLPTCAPRCRPNSELLTPHVTVTTDRSTMSHGWGRQKEAAKMESDNGRQIKYYIGRRERRDGSGSQSSREKARVRTVACPTRRLDRRFDRSSLASRVVS